MRLIVVLLTSSLVVCFTETVIPICPPACGQNLFSVSVAASLGGADILLPVLLLFCMFRRFYW